MLTWINGMKIICVICWKVDHAPFTYILASDQLKVGKMKIFANIFLSCNFANVINMNTMITI
jgi:hypothetical protein